jgi:hypothetical protein
LAQPVFKFALPDVLPELTNPINSSWEPMKRKDLWVSALLVCVSAAFAGAAQAQAVTGVTPVQDKPAVTDQAPGTTSIPVTLTNGFITQRLPFDVPFYVTGAAPSASRVDMYVYRIAGRTVVSQLQADLQETLTCVLPNGPTPVSRSFARPGAGGSFTLLVDALDPNRYYIFCFLSQGPVPTSEIEPAIRQTLAETVSPQHGRGPGLRLCASARRGREPVAKPRSSRSRRLGVHRRPREVE